MVRLRVLGAIELHGPDGREATSVLAQPKRLALLMYLAANAQSSHRRDTLLALLWPELDAVHGRSALNQAVAFLRRELGAGGAALVSRGDGELGIDPAHLWCDVRAFRDAVADKNFGEALELYRGDLAPGFFVNQAPGFEEWLERDRPRLRAMAGQAARSLAEQHEGGSNTASALAAARRAVELSTFDEIALRDLLALLDRVGDRAGATHAYDEFARRLHAELGTEPSEATKALLQRIRTRGAEAEASAPSVISPSVISPSVITPSMIGDSQTLNAASKVAPARARRSFTRTALTFVGVIAVVWAAVALLGATGIGPSASLLSSGKLRAREPLLVADFRVAGVDSAVGQAIAHATRTALQESRDVQIVPTERVDDALRRMRRLPGSFVDDGVAREIALREGIRAIVGGHVVRTNERFDVGLRLVAADSGSSLVSLHETASSLDDVIPTIDGLARRLRGRIGESISSVRASPPLPRVTSASMEALTLYAQSLRFQDFSPMVPVLERAVQVDTEFATAWRRLAIQYGNLGIKAVEARAAVMKAYQFRHKTSRIERLLIEASYYAMNGDRARQIETTEQVLIQGDTTPQVLSQLGEFYHRRREFVKAERYQRAALTLNGGVFIYYANLAEKLIELGRLDEADSIVLAGIARLGPNFPLVRSHLGVVYHRGQLDIYERALDSLRALTDPAIRRQTLSARRNLSLLRGRLDEWAKLHDETVSLNRSASALQSQTDPMERALVNLWIRRDTAHVVQFLRGAMTKSPMPHPERLALAQLAADAGQAELARTLLARFTANADTAATRRFAHLVHRINAGIASREGRAAEAVEEIRRGDMLPDGPADACVVCLYASLASVFDQAGKSDSALVMYERYVETVNVAHIVQDRLHLARVLERLGQLHERMGDPRKAVRYSARLVELWKGADAELQPRVAEARRRIVRLQSHLGTKDTSRRRGSGVGGTTAVSSTISNSSTGRPIPGNAYARRSASTGR